MAGDKISEVIVTATGGVHQMLSSSLIVLLQNSDFCHPGKAQVADSKIDGQKENVVESEKNNDERKSLRKKM